MIGTTGYKLNPEKLASARRELLPYLFSNFYYTEEFEYFDIIKYYLDIPPEPKTLEEISQELDEKIDKLIETTKWKFAYSKEGAEKRYNTKFDKIFDNFEYAKRNGYFLQYLSFTTSGNASIGNGIVPNSYLAVSGSLNSAFTSNFVIKPNGNDVGYWEIQPNIQVYRKTKPNRIVRYFTKLLLDFTWKDV